MFTRIRFFTNKILIANLLLIISGFFSPSEAKVFYVDNSLYVSGDGSSWEKAINNIQSALNISSDYDQIWIKEGMYLIENTLIISKKVEIYGGFAGTEEILVDRNWNVHKTIINGQNKVRCIEAKVGPITLNGLMIENGRTTGNGGGIFSASLNIENCIIRYNHADEVGGGIYSSDGISGKNVQIFNNSGLRAGGIGFSKSINLFNCTIVFNTGAGIHHHYIPGTIFWIKNSIIYHNTLQIAETVYGCTPQGQCSYSTYEINPSGVTYSSIENFKSGTTNISLDPQFVNGSIGDFRLTANSPCIDAGDPNTGKNITHKDYSQKDYFYNDRILDGNNDGISIIDIGAHEYGESLYLLFPIQSEKLNADQAPINIKWSGGLVGPTVKIEGSLDSGETWTIITSNAINKGSYNWFPAPPASNRYKIRVTDNEKPYISAFNAYDFALDMDEDGDGLMDLWELRFFGSIHHNPHSDYDSDGLSNIDEQELGTDPTEADTDMDGISDLDDTERLTGAWGIWPVPDINLDSNNLWGSHFLVDENSTLHLCYSKDGKFKYGKSVERNWVWDTLLNTDVFKSEMVIDRSGYAHIIYQNSPHGTLMYISNNQGTWTTEFIADAVTHSSLSIGPDNKIHIVYISDAIMTHVQINQNTMKKDVIDQNIVDGQSSKISIDSSGIAHIAYVKRTGLQGYEKNFLYYATYKLGLLTLKEIESIDDAYTFINNRLGIITDNNNNPHIVILLDTLYDIYFNGGGWFREKIGNGFNPSIIIDERNYRHLICTTSSYNSRQAIYRYDIGGNWHSIPVEIGEGSTKNSGEHLNQISMDKNGYLHSLIIERDSAGNGRLWYANNLPPEFTNLQGKWNLKVDHTNRSGSNLSHNFKVSDGIINIFQDQKDIALEFMDLVIYSSPYDSFIYNPLVQNKINKNELTDYTSHFVNAPIRIDPNVKAVNSIFASKTFIQFKSPFYAEGSIDIYFDLGGDIGNINSTVTISRPGASNPEGSNNGAGGGGGGCFINSCKK
jgi:hypothetical protein